MPQLFDASALTNLVLKRGKAALDAVKGNYILDLTPYEVGNAIWKLCTIKNLVGRGDARLLMDAVKKLMRRMNLVPVEDVDLVEIVDATTKEVTSYDASYVVVARLNGLTLITDDAKLARAAMKYVKVESSENLFKRVGIEAQGNYPEAEARKRLGGCPRKLAAPHRQSDAYEIALPL